ncbi:hypothetical protein [Chryseobacterium luquanense]|uniref:DUF3592 domain-containing protein n=1 Tax=Chryseobacterium luquanense TaxID=2983766 RepID=A0ABT3Y3I7_9FLAO|nr:hypothetical protein [Chryseobacterium luquanense]MCX8532717.1 hypothetical protein [Chryseobacterium luquanense]
MYTAIFTAIILILFVLKKKNENISFNSIVLRTVVTLCVTGIFIYLSEIIVTYTYDYFFAKKYEAKVVKYEYTEGDSDSGPVPIAIVEFKNDKNKILQKSTGYGTSHPIAIGKTIQISYNEGDKYVRNLTFSEMKLMVFFIIFFFGIFSIAFVAVVMNAFGKNLFVIWRLVSIILVYVVFPVFLLLFIVILSQVIWTYFYSEKNDVSILALLISGVFLIILVTLFLGYIANRFGKLKTYLKKPKKKPIKSFDFNKRIPK